MTSRECLNGSDHQKGGDGLPEEIISETLNVCVGPSVTKTPINSHPTTCVTAQENYSMAVGACGKTIRIENMSSVWESLCARLKEKSVVEQSAPQKDLLDYFRLWEIQDKEEWHKRWINHPREEVRLQIFKAMKELITDRFFPYDVTLEETMHVITELWKDVKEFERNYRGFFGTLTQADNYFLTSLHLAQD